MESREYKLILNYLLNQSSIMSIIFQLPNFNPAFALYNLQRTYLQLRNSYIDIDDSI